jgi:hypothetical protein
VLCVWSVQQAGVRMSGYLGSMCSGSHYVTIIDGDCMPLAIVGVHGVDKGVEACVRVHVWCHFHHSWHEWFGGVLLCAG